MLLEALGSSAEQGFLRALCITPSLTTMKVLVAMLCLLLANPVMVYIGVPQCMLVSLVSLLALSLLLILLLVIWAVE